ncbi:carbohydrate ABC transporter permease [Virgibacillus halodenitrificans]|uniref:Carbohydrate ABC transporter permease n=2 Tax=Virgibacillus halodenitrificans TaxID=1482 RepID=A0ABR7VH47_VIRHA|nr:carbohydrate ABC transporter permease [Virgibacillus halodenitrificans]MBD1221260.1 carbohydrate ABC transporter permease [Virgibacillus halodenitrificans]WHX26261.1 carbohydrate ABC transporter permease [Virgibacillus halodenitrificans]
MITKKFIQKALPYLVLSIIGIMFFIPLLWVIFASFDTHATLSIKLPEEFTLDNWKKILTDFEILRSFGIGVFLSLVSSIVLVFCSALAAYPLSRYHIKHKNSVILTILFMSGLPMTAIMVPVYQLFVFFNINDSLIATMLFMAASGLPYGIWLMKNFIDSVPITLEESAWIDGASVLTGLRKVVAPLMKPGIFTVLIFTFTNSWGNFFVPFILIQTREKLPASVTIFQFFGQHGMVFYGQLAAFSFVYTIPVIILYFVGQKYMSAGFSMGGASKG